MNAKHTPAPWIAQQGGDARTIWAGEVAIATVWKNSDANARLIAAAPAMLALLETISAMETEDEINERTDFGGMSGDDAAETLSALIDTARALAKAAT